MGDQALINLLKEDSPDAELKYNKLLGSTAAKELLMESHQSPMVYITFPSFLSRWNGYYPNNSEVVQANLNGQTTSQGMPSNAGNSYFQTHYNNQFTNGLYKSNGYPMNLRKIAITNGSLTGKLNGIDGEKILDVRGFQRVCIKPWSRFGIGGGPSYCFTIKLAEMHAYNLPTTGSRSRIAYYNTLTSDEKQTYSPNLNYRGNMDIVPGGTANATNDINTAITGKSIFDTRGSFWQYPGDNIGYFLSNRLGGANWEVRNLTPFQTFIPTFSGLGIIEPNQSWSNALNRNLVCSGETPFDSYFGEANNTEHISLNYRSVNWLLKELGDSTTPPSPQLPSFPLQEGLLYGDNVICLNSSANYSLDTCKTPGSAIWTLSSNLQLISSTGYNIVVKGVQGGQGIIKATFQNGRSITKTIWVGTSSPVVYGYHPSPSKIYHQYDECIVYFKDESGLLRLDASNTEIVFDSSSDFSFGGVFGNVLVLNTAIQSPYLNLSFKARVKNDCGWSEWKSFYYFLNGYNPYYNGYNFRISTSPTTAQLDVSIDESLNEKNKQIKTIHNHETEESYSIKIGDLTGAIQYQKENLKQKTEKTETTDWKPGAYYMKITNSKGESKNRGFIVN